jgi:hypothetical protein
MTIHLPDCLVLSRQAVTIQIKQVMSRQAVINQSITVTSVAEAVAACGSHPSDPDEVAAGLSLAPALLAAAAVEGSHPGTAHSVTHDHRAGLVLWRPDKSPQSRTSTVAP